MKVILACVADYALVDSMGKLSVMGIFDNINSQKFPTTHPKMVLAVRMMVEHEDGGKKHEVRIRLLDEDGQMAAEIKGQLEASKEIPPGQFGVQNAVFDLVGVQFRKPGRYIWEIVATGQPPVLVPFDLRKVG